VPCVFLSRAVGVRACSPKEACRELDTRTMGGFPKTRMKTMPLPKRIGMSPSLSGDESLLPVTRRTNPGSRSGSGRRRAVLLAGSAVWVLSVARTGPALGEGCALRPRESLVVELTGVMNLKDLDEGVNYELRYIVEGDWLSPIAEEIGISVRLLGGRRFSRTARGCLPSERYRTSDGSVRELVFRREVRVGDELRT
jgi:hypothetical protein